MEGKPIKDDHFKRMKGSDVGLEWLKEDEDAMKEPIVIETPEGLGMKMPEDFGVEDVALLVGENSPLEVIGIVSFPITNHTFSSFIQTPLPSRVPPAGP